MKNNYLANEKIFAPQLYSTDTEKSNINDVTAVINVVEYFLLLFLLFILIVVLYVTKHVTVQNLNCSYLPLNSGFRFSKNEFTPSLKSSVPPAASWY